MDNDVAHCEALVRAADKDRFLSVLFAPAEHRGALYALYAFNVEMARVREQVKEQLAGEIRLQWWREALSGGRNEEARGHPVAAALAGVIGRYRLAPRLFEELIEARRFDLGNELPGSLDEVERYVRHTQSNLIELAALILGTAAANFADPAGISIGITGLLRRFAVDVASGRLMVPADLLVRHKVLPQEVLAGQSSEGLVAVLAALRDLAAKRYEEAQALTRDNELLAAWLPAALVPLDLRALRRGARRPFRPIVVPQWRRQWALWRVARRGCLGPL